MRVERLWVTDFRNYESADLSPAPGLTVVVGDNGEGKTNLLEAVGYLATLSSFRGAPAEALVRVGAESAVVRAEGEREGRSLLIEASMQRAGRDRVMVNRQPLRRARDLVDDLRRGVSTVGPHRDELALGLAGMPARTHASQGEQRSLALALRLAAHAVVTEEVGSAPVLLLDDVFSELDPDRAEALVAHLPAGQALLTTAGGVPPGDHPELVVHVRDGRLCS